MDRTLCFIIEDQNIYLEQVLVEYMGVPIFFVCHDEKQRYLALCVDVDELQYFVTMIAPRDMFDLLHGNVPMRNVILKQNKFWKVISGEEPVDDVVVECSIDDIDCNVLPQENAFFEILTKDIAEYVKKFDADFWSEEYDTTLCAQINKSDYLSTYKYVAVTKYEDSEVLVQEESSAILNSLIKRSLISKGHEWLTSENNACAA